MKNAFVAQRMNLTRGNEKTCLIGGKGTMFHLFACLRWAPDYDGFEHPRRRVHAAPAGTCMGRGSGGADPRPATHGTGVEPHGVGAAVKSHQCGRSGVR